MKRIYLDHNASTSLDPRVLDVLIQELQEEEGNPSSIHFHGQHSRRKLERIRATLAHIFKVKPQEIFFTSGGTEGAAILLQGIMQQKQKGHVISSAVEHACVYQTLQAYQKKGWEVEYLPVGPWGAVKKEAVEQAIRPDTAFVTLMAVNNETGVITDIEGIAEITRKYTIPFIVDGVALLGKEKFEIPLGVSALFFSGHKIHAPKGVGFCVCRSALKLAPLFLGGEQEFHKRAGTENLSGIVALGKAMEVLQEEQEVDIAKMRRLRDRLETELTSHLPHVMINGLGPRVSNTSNLAFLGMDGEALLINLDLKGISVSHGSACASGALEPSRILLEMGMPLQQVRSSLRFSLSKTTTEEEIDQVVKILVDLVRKK